MTDWMNKELDAAYLLESGILFEINRSILHQLGIAMVVKKEENGKLILCLKDNRDKPEINIFTKDVYEKGHIKLRKFMYEFGHQQMRKRSDALGWSSQSWYVPDNKRYNNE